MERGRFDALTRIVATPGSRRAALAALAGALFVGPAAAQNNGRQDGRGHHAGQRHHGGHAGPPRGGSRCDVDDDCPNAEDACCDGRCIDVSRSRDHCGSCTKLCADSEICSGGACVVCDVCDPGRRQCAYRSLREAIDAANPRATIRICPGSYKERVRLSKDLTLVGLGERPQDVELDGQNRSARAAVLTVDPRVNVIVRNLKITGGRANNEQAGGGVTNFGLLILDQVHISDNDAARFNGGGVLNSGADARLSLTACKVTKNEATDGGGVSNDQGVVTVTNSQIEQNEARSGGGGIHTHGGRVDLRRSSVTANSAQAGGGIEIDHGGTVNINGSVFVDDNKARAIGGGINNFQGTLVISGESNAITANRADRDGGGVFNAGSMAVSASQGGKRAIFGNDPNDCVDSGGGTGCPA